MYWLFICIWHKRKKTFIWTLCRVHHDGEVKALEAWGDGYIGSTDRVECWCSDHFLLFRMGHLTLGNPTEELP